MHRAAPVSEPADLRPRHVAAHAALRPKRRIVAPVASVTPGASAPPLVAPVAADSAARLPWSLLAPAGASAARHRRAGSPPPARSSGDDAPSVRAAAPAVGAPRRSSPRRSLRRRAPPPAPGWSSFRPPSRVPRSPRRSPPRRARMAGGIAVGAFFFVHASRRSRPSRRSAHGTGRVPFHARCDGRRPDRARSPSLVPSRSSSMG